MLICDEPDHDEAVEIRSLTTEEAAALQQELDRFRDDALYFDAHREEFLATYRDLWIAVYDKQVVAAAPDHGALLEQLDARGIPCGNAYRVYVTDDDVDLFL